MARVLQMALFDDALCEVEQDGVRYVLRRKPVRAAELAVTRAGKQATRGGAGSSSGISYLEKHVRAKVATAEKKSAGQDGAAEGRDVVG